MLVILALVTSVISLICSLLTFLYLKNAFNQNAKNLELWANGMEKRTRAMEEKLRMYVE